MNRQNILLLNLLLSVFIAVAIYYNISAKNKLSDTKVACIDFITMSNKLIALKSRWSNNKMDQRVIFKIKRVIPARLTVDKNRSTLLEADIPSQSKLDEVLKIILNSTLKIDKINIAPRKVGVHLQVKFKTGKDI